MPKRTIVIGGLSLIWGAVLIFNVWPSLRGDYGWRWPYAVPEFARLVPLIVGLGMYGGVAFQFLQRPSARGLLMSAVVGTVGLTLAALYVNGSPLFHLFTITVSGGAGGWHYAAAHITDWPATLRHWPDYMRSAAATFSSHLGIAPPGLVIGYGFVNQILMRWPHLAEFLAAPLRALQCQNFLLMNYSNAQLASAWAGILTPLWAGLAAFPLYVAGRLSFDEAAARRAVLWWPLVPGLLMFAPVPNTFYPLLSLLALALLLLALRRHQLRWAFLAGLVLSVGTLLTFAFFPLLLLLGLLTLSTQLIWKQWRSPPAWTWPLLIGLTVGAGLSVFWLALYLSAGLTPLDILREASGAHLALDRPYWPWLVLHLNDFFMFTGWPLTLLAGMAVWAAVRRLVAFPAHTSFGDHLSLASAVTLLALDVSGTLRGESGRILLYLSPLVLLLAANQLASREMPLITVFQMAMVVCLAGFLRVLSSEFSAPPPPPALASIPTDTLLRESSALFDKRLHLVSFAGQMETTPTPALRLWLDWETVGPVAVPYYLAFVPVSPTGQTAAQATLLQPYAGQYPMTCWPQAKALLRTELFIPLDSAAQTGDWWVSLAVVNGATGETLPVQLPDGTTDTQVGLGPFHP